MDNIPGFSFFASTLFTVPDQNTTPSSLIVTAMSDPICRSGTLSAAMET